MAAQGAAWAAGLRSCSEEKFALILNDVEPHIELHLEEWSCEAPRTWPAFACTLCTHVSCTLQLVVHAARGPFFFAFLALRLEDVQSLIRIT